MEIKCEYCGSMIPETVEQCPYCGASNNSIKRTADGTPKTIAELAKWYEDRHLPPYETTRFFIGIDYRQLGHLVFIRMEMNLSSTKIRPTALVRCDIRVQMRRMLLMSCILN